MSLKVIDVYKRQGVVAAIVLFVLFMLNKNKFVKNKDSKNIA